MPRYLPFLALTATAVAAGGILYALGVGLKQAGPAKSVFHGALPQLFSPTSIWNEPLKRDAPLDPHSRALVTGLDREIAREVATGAGPWISTRKCSTPLYVVPRDQPTRTIHLTHPEAFWRRSLARAFEHVPIPPNARPADCVDRHLTIWQPTTDRLWEFFHLRRRKGSWQADWGGAMRRVSHSPGYYTRKSWRGLSAPNWGATATSLPVAGGVMLLRELRKLRVDHALALNLPVARAGVFSWPAQRSDGIGGAGTIPEGARLRLDPNLDLASLGLPPVTLAIARAVQRYGAIVRDQTGPGNVVSFFAEDPRPPGSDPYDGRGGIFEGLPPNLLLSSFPWDHLQLLKMKLCTKTPCLQR